MKVICKQTGQNMTVMLDDQRYSKAVSDAGEREQIKSWALELKELTEKEKPSKKDESRSNAIVALIQLYYTPKLAAQKEVKEKIAKKKLENVVEPTIAEKVEEIVKIADKDSLQNELDALNKRRDEITKQLDESRNLKNGVAAKVSYGGSREY